jgi:nickel/cobalt transporter (NiCoT) family protein
MEQAMGGIIHPEMMGMVALVFMLGLRHGFDPDHLVAIDGMTRSTQSRWCGLFFSLGHGVVVTLLGIAVALAATEWQAPAWLEHTGALISIGVLLALGFANLAMLFRTPGDTPVRLIGLRGRWLTERLARANHPAVIASMGAAFAVSFDTVSHALAFSLTGATMAGVLFAGLLGLVFTLGMVTTDALNGLWVAKMMAGTDRRLAAASRWMSGGVAFLCLLIAVLGFLKHAMPALDELAEPLSLPLSIATLVLVTSIGGFAVLRSRSAYREVHS